MEDAQPLNLFFDNNTRVQFVWEYIWLSSKMRSANESNQQIFGNDIRYGKYQILLLHYDAFHCFTVDQRSALYEFFSPADHCRWY